MKKLVVILLLFCFSSSFAQRDKKVITLDRANIDSIFAKSDTSNGAGRTTFPDTLNIEGQLLVKGVPITNAGSDTANVLGSFDDPSGYLDSDSVLSRSKIDSLVKLVAQDSSNALRDEISRVLMRAGENLIKYDIVYLLTASDSAVYKAISSDTSKINIIGVADEGITSGQLGYIKILGVLDSASWNWNAGDVYLSDVDGKFTQVVPISPNALIILGKSVSNKRIIFIPNGIVILQ